MAGLPITAFEQVLAIFKSAVPVEIPVGTARVALVEAADAEAVLAHKWITGGARYAVAKINGKRVSMHRFLMEVSEDMFVDHIDGNGLNNQRSNLRICTHQQNMCNRVNQKAGQSRFKGVYLERGKWRAEIRAEGRKISLGSFHSEVRAAKAYDRAAILYHGEFARTNASLGLF